MFNYIKNIQDNISSIILLKYNIQKDLLVMIEKPKDIKNGDFSSNIAMLLSSILKKNGKDLADEIALEIKKNNFFIDQFEKIEIAKNGFLNFFLKKKSYLKIMNDILNDEKYGSSNIGSGKKINIEFCSANPTGPVHLGHIRGAVWGMVISNIMLECGFKVDREYYINDGGGQIETLIISVFLRYLENFSYDIKIPDGFYPGEYIKQIAILMKEKFNNKFLIEFEEFKSNNILIDNIRNFLCKNEKIFLIIRRFVLDEILKIIKSDLAYFGIEFDIFSSETEIIDSNNNEILNETLRIFEEKNLLYYGILDKPKNSDDIEDWESREQLLFKSTKFGDDMDRAMKRSSGEWTYFAKDCAYHLHKLKRNYDQMIIEVGADHIGYKKRLTSAVHALSSSIFHKNIDFNFEFHNMVYIRKNDENLKMSKRSGNLVGADFIKENIGSDITKFYLLSKKHDMELEFNIDKASEISKENPYFYIQYAFVRGFSILKNFNENYKFLFKKDDSNILNYEIDSNNIDISVYERNILNHIIFLTKTIEQIILKLEPHKLNFYLSDLASYFHIWWNDGNLNYDSRILFLTKKEWDIDKNQNQTRDKIFFRILIVKLIMKTLKYCLSLINIRPIEKM